MDIGEQLGDAHHGMQTLQALLGACAQPVTLDTRGLQVLLGPLADGIEQAAALSHALTVHIHPPD